MEETNEEETFPHMIVRCEDCGYTDDGYLIRIVEQEAQQHAEEHNHKVIVSVQEYFVIDYRK